MDKIAFLFKKMHCHHCGTELKRTGVLYTAEVDPAKYWNYKEAQKKRLYGGKTVDLFTETKNGIITSSDARFGYKCPNCNSIISIKSQREIKKLQKKHHCKILSPELTKHIHMAQKRTYTDEELYWAFVKDADADPYLKKPDYIE